MRMLFIHMAIITCTRGDVMNIKGYNVTIEQCVRMYRYECWEIGRDSPCLVRIYLNKKTNEYRAIANIYFYNKKTHSRHYFNVEKCSFEDEALEKLLLLFKNFYETHNIDCVQAIPSEDSEWVGKIVPFWKF